MNKAFENIKSTSAALFFEIKAHLGEGLLWDDINQKLLWVDIEGHLFHMLDTITLNNFSFTLPKRVGSVVQRNKSTYLLAVEDGLLDLNTDTGHIVYCLRTYIHEQHSRRFNDGKCDPQGRFWVGTLSMDGVSKVSSLYCFDSRNGGLVEKVSNVTISNGIAWSPDGKKMYYIDTIAGDIMQYDFDGRDGTISNKKLILHLFPEQGYPDGMTADKDGYLWVALWAGYGVIQINPENGEVLQFINVPAPNVTSCVFGGPNLDILFISSARVEVSTENLAKYPLSGSIFAIHTGSKGMLANKYKS